MSRKQEIFLSGLIIHSHLEEVNRDEERTLE